MVQDTPSRKLDQYIVRFPDGMRDRLKQEAAANNRSLNSEIIARLEASLSASPAEEDFWNKEFVARLVNQMADELDRRGAKMVTVRKRFEDYDPTDARKKAIAEGEASGLREPRKPKP